MGLPKVNIAYQNGLLGTIANSLDGLLLMCVKGATVLSTFVADKPYKIYRLAGLDELGVTSANNATLYKAVKQFYCEAPEGTPLYVATYSDETMQALCDKDSGKLKGMLQGLKGEIRGVVVLHSDSEPSKVETGLSSEVFDAIPKAQALGDMIAVEMYAPIFIILDGYAYSGNSGELKDLSKEKNNRVMVFIGSEDSKDKHSAVGYLAGRIARIPVQRNIGRVKDGAIAATAMYLGSKAVEESVDDVTTIYDKGYVTPRVHTGRSGYYYTDDCLAVEMTDDYAHLTARRTIDKVVRIAYNKILDILLDEIELTDDGTIQEPVVRALEADIETVINASMTAAGELASVDGSGVECSIDASQNVRATSKIEIVVSARPFGYPRNIVAKFGFKVE